MKQIDFEQLDNLAWDIVCNWHKKVDFDPIYEGVDFSLLTRSVLRTKIGKAIRLKHDLCNINLNSAVECGTYAQSFCPQRLVHGIRCTLQVHLHPCSNHCKQKHCTSVFTSTAESRIKNIQSKHIKQSARDRKNMGNVCRSFVTYFKLKFNFRRKVCYIPQYARPLHSVCSDMFSDDFFLCITRDSDIGNKFVYPLKLNGTIEFNDFMESLYTSIFHSLNEYGLVLQDMDAEELRKEINTLGQMFLKAKKELQIIKPDLIILYSDESLPQMCYVLIAKQMGIKTLSLQHGLDCEILYLDEPYADLLLLWGEWRKQRYEDSNNIFKSSFEVVGNPEYDNIEFSDYSEVNDGYWLWVTRPHSPDKCYSPSRSETEGADILKAILLSLEKYPSEELVIKPHPYDNFDLYEDIVENSGMSDRVRISMDSPMDLYKDAKFVITEDSTAGLEALLFGKNMIHVNFASQPVSVPFSKYDVALLARNEDDFSGMVEKVLQNEYCLDLESRKSFVFHLLFCMDGKSTERAVNCIKDYLEGN
jgi:hypothetical protein